MFSFLKQWLRLFYAFWVLIRTDLAIKGLQILDLPTWPLVLFRLGSTPAPIQTALEKLGPAYVKLGQSLASRPDIIGEELAAALRILQDKMQPFAMALAIERIEKNTQKPLAETFLDFSAPIAAASIAQVHKASILQGDDVIPVAVKILRPGIQKTLLTDIAAFARFAALAEKCSKQAQRLQPTQVVDVLKKSVAEELDLRLEAGVMSEMRQNMSQETALRIPYVIWPLTYKDMLVTQWVEGTPLTNTQALIEGGFDLETLSTTLMQSFLKQALFFGCFHADLHQGNLMVDKNNALVMLDFGIVGRIEPKERHFLAQILWSFITGDYDKGAQVHFDAGYVPLEHSPKAFSAALRSIGAPILDKTAEDISIARLLTQLFEFTQHFGMQTRPELLLLQKTMVVAEGVARSLNPKLDIWRVSEPVVKEFLQSQMGLKSKLKSAEQSVHAALETMQKIPTMVESAQSSLQILAQNSQTQPTSSKTTHIALALILSLLIFLVWKLT